MQVKQLRDAKPYEAPNHRGYCSLRLFGLDAGGPKQFTVGLSYFLPGGGAGPDASPTEKVYYVLAGELTLITGGQRDRAQGRRFLLHRAEREPRDHQSRQRGRHHAGGGVDAAEVTVMSEQDLLQNPLSLFDIRGKTAIVTGATGAFGALAAKVLAGAGANVVICANNAAELEKVAAQCRKLGGKVVSRGQAAELGRKLQRDRAGGGRPVRPRRHPGGGLRPEQGLQDRGPEAGRFSRRHGRQCHAVLADRARGRAADARTGAGRQGDPDVVGARAARPSRRLHAPIARRSRRSTASPRRSAANGVAPASPSMRSGRRCFARR